MRLTQRDRTLLQDLRDFRWLTTRQIAVHWFASTTRKNTQRRLRLLRRAGYLRSVRPHLMAEALHTLGKRALELCEPDAARPLERQPPKHLDHFCGLTDIRLAIQERARQQAIGIRYFLPAWELTAPAWPFAVIPDAIAELQERENLATLIIEYDRGTEPVGFLENKLRIYAQGLDGFEFVEVLTVTERRQRHARLQDAARRSISDPRFRFLLRPDLAAYDLRTLFNRPASR